MSTTEKIDSEWRSYFKRLDFLKLDNWPRSHSISSIDRFFKVFCRFRGYCLLTRMFLGLEACVTLFRCTLHRLCTKECRSFFCRRLCAIFIRNVGYWWLMLNMHENTWTCIMVLQDMTSIFWQRNKWAAKTNLWILMVCSKGKVWWNPSKPGWFTHHLQMVRIHLFIHLLWWPGIISCQVLKSRRSVGVGGSYSWPKKDDAWCIYDES